MRLLPSTRPGRVLSAARILLVVLFLGQAKTDEADLQAESSVDAKTRAFQANPLCDGPLESPIDVDSETSFSRSDLEARILHRPWTLGDIEHKDNTSFFRRITFKPSQPLGTIQVGKGLGDFDTYRFTAVDVHVPSQHTFGRMTWPVEIQLWHEPGALQDVADFGLYVSELEKRLWSEDLFSPLNTMAESLNNLVEGEVSPWGDSSLISWAEKLSWIDTSRNSLKDEAVNVREMATSQLHAVSELTTKAAEMVASHNRPFAAHQIVVSLFIRRSFDESDEPRRSETTSLMEWLISAQSGNKTDPPVNTPTGPIVDITKLLSLNSHGNPESLLMYEGSLTEQPCTHGVRWLIKREPLVTSPALLNSLIIALSKDGAASSSSTDLRSTSSILGESGRVQPLGNDREIHSVQIGDTSFGDSGVHLVSNMGNQQKWLYIQRYCKVFFLCAACAIITPFIFKLVRICVDSINRDAENASIEGAERKRSSSVECTDIQKELLRVARPRVGSSGDARHGLSTRMLSAFDNGRAGEPKGIFKSTSMRSQKVDIQDGVISEVSDSSASISSASETWSPTVRTSQLNPNTNAAKQIEAGHSCHEEPSTVDESRKHVAIEQVKGDSDGERKGGQCSGGKRDGGGASGNVEGGSDGGGSGAEGGGPRDVTSDRGADGYGNEDGGAVCGRGDGGGADGGDGRGIGGGAGEAGVPGGEEAKRGFVSDGLSVAESNK